MLSAGLALFGAVVYGAADFFGGLAAKRLRSIVVTAASAASGLIFLAVLLPFIGGAWALLIGILLAFSVVSGLALGGYRALARRGRKGEEGDALITLHLGQ